MDYSGKKSNTNKCSKDSKVKLKEHVDSEACELVENKALSGQSRAKVDSSGINVYRTLSNQDGFTNTESNKTNEFVQHHTLRLHTEESEPKPQEQLNYPQEPIWQPDVDSISNNSIIVQPVTAYKQARRTRNEKKSQDEVLHNFVKLESLLINIFKNSALSIGDFELSELELYIVVEMILRKNRNMTAYP